MFAFRFRAPNPASDTSDGAGEFLEAEGDLGVGRLGVDRTTFGRTLPYVFEGSSGIYNVFGTAG
jgi:hypothetical protein